MNLKSLLKTASLLSAFALAGCSFARGWNTVDGNGKVVSQTRAVSGFDAVSVSGPGELTVSQGSEESLVIEADENLLPLIESKVSGGHLWIGPRHVNVRPTKGIRYELKLKNLNALALSGSIHADLGRIKTENLTLRVSGSGAIEVGPLEVKDLSAQTSGSGRVEVTQLEATQLSVHISGSGRTEMAGSVERQEIRISGSGRYDASELRSNQAIADISGSGRATIKVKDTLKAKTSGSGGVKYYGSPQVTRSVSGSGHVSHLSDT